MGGRGASSGMSYKGNRYGSQYHTRLEVDNIKFVEKNSRQSETLMETMTGGRIYVEIGGDEPIRIVFFDNSNKRNKVIERNKRSGEWHVHEGYLHAEYGTSDHEKLSKDDKKLLDRVLSLWKNKQ